MHLEYGTRGFLVASHEIVAQKSELPERFDTLPEGFQTDRENLATTGFYVVLTV